MMTPLKQHLQDEVEKHYKEYAERIERIRDFNRA